MSALKTGIDSAYAYRFIRLMQKNFNEWKAYQTGIIDERGNVIKRPKTEEEKSSYTPFHASVRAFKRMVNTVPGASTFGAISSGWSAIGSRFGLTEADCALIAKELNNPLYEMVAGDSGGNPTKIAAGVTSGDITGIGPAAMGMSKRKKPRVIVNQNKV